MTYSINEAALAKWKDVLDQENLPKIRNRIVRAEVAKMLENTERELGVAGSYGGEGSQFLLGEAAPTNAMGFSSSTQGSGAIDTFDPILISLVRRSMPNLVAFEGLCGVQTMTGPTGLIFAMRTRYASQTGGEAFYNEANTLFTSFVGTNATANTYNAPQGNNWYTQQGAFGANTPGGANLVSMGSNSTYSIPGNTSGNNAGSEVYNYGGALSTFLVLRASYRISSQPKFLLKSIVKSSVLSM